MASIAEKSKRVEVDSSHLSDGTMVYHDVASGMVTIITPDGDGLVIDRDVAISICELLYVSSAWEPTDGDKEDREGYSRTPRRSSR